MVDPIGNIIFVSGEEDINNSMHLFEMRFTRKENSSMKSTVYRKKTLTDQSVRGCLEKGHIYQHLEIL